MASSAQKTPTRTPSNNNYANPHNTPIASAKRPRSSLGDRTPTTTTTPATAAMSPMHPPRPVEHDSHTTKEPESSSWVGRQVDALFSPVLSFLGTKDDVASVTDEDVSMSVKETETTTTTSSSVESCGVIAEEEEEEGVPAAPVEEEEEEKEELHHDMTDLEENPSSSFDEEEFNPYLFIKSLPPYRLVAPARPRLALPPKSASSPDITLVLDLDETLVHCTVDPTPDANLIFPVVFHGMEYQVHVRLRPYLYEFLERVHNQYEVVVFTASQKVYADELLNRIDPDGKYIHHRMFRESCLPVEGNFLKDLNVLGRDLSKTVLVDNSPHAFGYQVDNGIPIESWFDDAHDRELMKLEKFLRTLPGNDDVRTAVRAQFQTRERVEAA